jgi:hypothetical protein
MKYLWLILFCLATCKCAEPNKRYYWKWSSHVPVKQFLWRNDTIYLLHADTVINQMPCTKRESEIIFDVLVRN